MISYLKDPKQYAQELYDLGITYADWAGSYPHLANSDYGFDLNDELDRLWAHSEWQKGFERALWDDPTGQDLDYFLGYD